MQLIDVESGAVLNQQTSQLVAESSTTETQNSKARLEAFKKKKRLEALKKQQLSRASSLTSESTPDVQQKNIDFALTWVVLPKTLGSNNYEYLSFVEHGLNILNQEDEKSLVGPSKLLLAGVRNPEYDTVTGMQTDILIGLNARGLLQLK